MSKIKSKNPEMQGEYLVREVYRALIAEYQKTGKDYSKLRKRLNELEDEKWGNLFPGMPLRRRVN